MNPTEHAGFVVFLILHTPLLAWCIFRWMMIRLLVWLYTPCGETGLTPNQLLDALSKIMGYTGRTEWNDADVYVMSRICSWVMASVDAELEGATK